MKRLRSGARAMMMLAIGASLTAISPSPAQAGVKVKTSTSYYRISGSDGRALNKSMLEGGRSRIKLSHAIAATETELDFGEPKIAVKNGRCVVEQVDVFLKIRYIYPRWPGRSRASGELRRSWDAFWKELKRHEENHGEIARAGAESLHKELMRMNGNVAIGCADFGTLAKFRLDAIVRRTANAQRSFDRREYRANSRISRLQRALFEAR